MDYEEGKYQQTGGFWDMDLAKEGENQLDGTQDKWRDTTNDGRKRVPEWNNPKPT